MIATAFITVIFFVAIKNTDTHRSITPENSNKDADFLSLDDIFLQTKYDIAANKIKATTAR